MCMLRTLRNSSYSNNEKPDKRQSCKITQILPQPFQGLSPLTHSAGRGLLPQSREFGLRLSSPSSSRPPLLPRGPGPGASNSPVCLYGANEELGAVGVGARVGHGQDTCKNTRGDQAAQEASHLGAVPARMTQTTGRMLEAEDTWGSEERAKPRAHSHPGPVRLDDIGGKGLLGALSGRAGPGPPALNSSFFHIARWVLKVTQS